jgi:energy-coupling factor transporter ATP-binding protein EcfA2
MAEQTTCNTSGYSAAGDLSKPDKTIVLFGKTGVGKSTIARHIFKQDNDRFRNVGAVSSMTRKAEECYDDVHLWIDNSNVHVRVRVIILDTSSLHGQKCDIFQFMSHYDVKEISTIIFVLKHGRVTKDDCRPFDKIIDDFKTLRCDDDGSDILKVCGHLLITCCEGQDEKGRENIVKMYESDPMTQKLCQSVKEIKCVGFPDHNSLQPIMIDLYEEGIKNDEQALHDIVKTSLNLLVYAPVDPAAPQNPLPQADIHGRSTAHHDKPKWYTRTYRTMVNQISGKSRQN